MIYLFSLLFSSFVFAETPKCQISYGTLDIPQVDFSTEEDFYFCFGKLHGQDRAWEMDYFRRTGQGRNAEVLGFGQLKSDLMMRLLDLPATAEKIWQSYPQDKKKWLEIYAQGVNEGFKTGKESQEFLDQGYGPEPWTPQDTLLVLFLQSFDQTKKTFSTDYEEERTKKKWKDEAPALFSDENVPWLSTILKDGEYPKKKLEAKTVMHEQHDLKLWSDFPTLFGLESGSNNWVVNAKKSKSGFSLLANDPHLDLKTPSFWYFAKFKSQTVTMMGASVPGVPILPSGTNGKVAWGLTNAYYNSADARLVSDVKNSDLQNIRPLVWVKLGFLKLPFFFKSFDLLKSGHKILPLELETKHKLVLRWTGFNLNPQDIYPMFDMIHVKNVTEMDTLLSNVGLPAWNYVFADSAGDIGYRMVGKTYRMTERNAYGTEVVTKEELLKEEFLTPEERPHVLRPKRHYIYSANNRHFPADAEFYGGRAYSQSFRGFRLDELLKEIQTPKSFQETQCDGQVVDARFFLPLLQKYLEVPEFTEWNMLSDDASKALPLYRRIMDLLYEKWEVNEYALYNLLQNLPPKLKQEIVLIEKKAREEVNGRTWGEFHHISFPHLSKNSNWDFSPEMPGVGDSQTINPGTAKWNPDTNRYEQYSGASMRIIFEMSNPVKIWLNYPGINRNYTKRHNDTAWKGWKNCVYTEMSL